MIEVEQIGPDRLDDYDAIPMSFLVDSRFRVEIVDSGFGGFRLVEEPVDPPWTKDYEEGEPDGARRWAKRWGAENWAYLLASNDGQVAGGAVIATRTPDAWMLDGRDDLAVLWDIRVHPDHQRIGVGRTLFDRAVEWSRSEGMTQLKIETQNNNVRACRFYASMGCELRSIIHHAYATESRRWAEEVEFNWWLDL